MLKFKLGCYIPFIIIIIIIILVRCLISYLLLAVVVHQAQKVERTIGQRVLDDTLKFGNGGLAIAILPDAEGEKVFPGRDPIQPISEELDACTA